jgi:CRISPR/Cas system-associated endoribonuclease Cas2
MRKYQKEMLKLTAGEILTSMFDLALPFFEASPLYRQSTKKYLEQRQVERQQFWNRIRYLRKMGYINSFIEEKEKFIELTPKGYDYLKKFSFENIKIAKPKSWDGKWRVIIFDIPEKSRESRDALRAKLMRLGFYQIQKSVYVYPFECAREISFLTDYLQIKDFVLIMISEIIQGEEKIIESFLNNHTLTKSDLRKANH